MEQEIPIPREFVPAVIGRQGSRIKEIATKSGAKLNFHGDKDVEAKFRMCVVRGTVENIRIAEAMLRDIIENQPLIESYEIFVPNYACGSIVGKGGRIIKELQSSTGTKIILDNNNNYDRSVYTD